MQAMITETPNIEEQTKQKNILQRKFKDEMKQTDMKLVLQLDQKVNNLQKCH